jgi:tape measure domain-containing protein
MAVNVTGSDSGQLSFEATLNISPFAAEEAKLRSHIQNTTSAVNQQSTALEGLAVKAAAAIAAYASFAAAGNFVQNIVKVRGEFQQLEVAFRTMLHSKEDADKLMAQAVQLASITPFTLQDVGQGAKQLLAYGFAAKDITATLSKLGDVASGVGAPLNDIVFLYGTLQVQGRAYTRDILQFTQRGIPIIGELAKQFGVTKDQVQQLVEAGKVGFPEVEKAFNAMTGSGGIFFNLMQEQSKTLTGELSNLSDAWSRMLNDIGKSNEGIFSDAILSATSLINNYKEVIKVIETVAIGYGSYRAAIIATTVAQSFATAAAQGYTAAQILEYNALLIAEKAQKLLNATMLANPYVAVATVLGTLIAAMAVFGTEAERSVDKMHLVNEAQKNLSKQFEDQQVKLQALSGQLKSTALTEERRLEIVKEVNAINPHILDGIDSQTASTKELTGALDNYVQKRREQIALDANSAAIEASIKKENELRDAIKETGEQLKLSNDVRKRGQDFTNALAPGTTAVNEQILKDKIDDLNKSLNDQIKTTKELGDARAQSNDVADQANKTAARSVAIIDDEISALKDQQKNLSDTSAKYKQYNEQIKKLEAEREAITGKAAAKNFAKETTDRVKDIKEFYDQLAKLEIESKRSALSAEEVEIDKINQKYKQASEQATKLGLGIGVQQRIASLQNAELKNLNIETETQKYAKSLDDQKAIFEKFEAAKAEIGDRAAREMFGEQTKGFDTFLAFLESEGEKFILARGTREGQLKLQAITARYSPEQQAQLEKQKQAEIDALKAALDASVTFDAKRRAIDKKYFEDKAALEKQTSLPDLKGRLEQLKSSHEDEIAEVNRSAREQSGIYKKLNEDITEFTRQQLKARLRDLKNQLETDTTLSPVMKENIRRYIEELNGLIKESSKGADLARDFNKLGGQLSQISSDFQNLANGVQELNADLAETLQTLSDITGVAASVAKSIANFASGNIVGGISDAISAIVGVFKIFAKAKESQRQAQKEIDDFNLQLLTGEVNITEEYRNRQREQVKLNALRIQGLEDEKKLLEEQKKATEAQYNLILKQLQDQTAVIGKTTEKFGGFLGIGRKTRAVDITESLSGKSFDEP